MIERGEGREIAKPELFQDWAAAGLVFCSNRVVHTLACASSAMPAPVPCEYTAAITETRRNTVESRYGLEWKWPC